MDRKPPEKRITMACTGVGLASVLAMDYLPSRPGDAGRSLETRIDDIESFLIPSTVKEY